MSVSIVVPCYRSAGILPMLVTRLTKVMSAAVGQYELILVVDGSPDDTWQVAADLAEHHEAVRAIQLARNYGQHNALVAGIRVARYDVVVTMDDDLQHPPEEIPTLLAALTDDLDLVYATPIEEEHGALRSFASRVIKAGLSGPLGIRNARMVGAFRAFRTSLRAGFDRVSGPYMSVDVALSWATTRVGSVPLRMDRRTVGRSGYTLTSLARHAGNMILGYSTTPLRLVTYLGCLVGTGGLMLLAYVLWRYAHGGTTVAGYTTIASMIALFSSAQMLAIGVLGEYIGRIHAHGIGRPSYVVRSAHAWTAPRTRAQPGVDRLDPREPDEHRPDERRYVHVEP